MSAVDALPALFVPRLAERVLVAADNQHIAAGALDGVESLLANLLRRLAAAADERTDRRAQLLRNFVDRWLLDLLRLPGRRRRCARRRVARLARLQRLCVGNRFRLRIRRRHHDSILFLIFVILINTLKNRNNARTTHTFSSATRFAAASASFSRSS